MIVTHSESVAHFFCQCFGLIYKYSWIELLNNNWNDPRYVRLFILSGFRLKFVSMLIAHP